VFFVIRTFEKLKERELSMAKQIIEVITILWDFVAFDELQSVFAEWIHRLTRVIAKKGEYYTK
jgi:hypothetical protein